MNLWPAVPLLIAMVIVGSYFLAHGYDLLHVPVFLSGPGDRRCRSPVAYPVAPMMGLTVATFAALLQAQSCVSPSWWT